jgi:outer membrane autotransporter protein
MIETSLSGDTEQATEALDAITPDAASSPKNDALASIGLQAVNIAGRLTALRTGVGGFSTAGLNIDLDGTRISGSQMQSLLEALTGGGASADDSGFSRLGVFVSGTLVSGDRDPTTNEEGFDYDAYGLTLGVDYRLNDNLILGGALGYSSTEADVDNDRGKLDADSYAITFYGTYYQTDNFFIDGSLSYGRSDYDQERRVRYTLPNVNVNQDFFSDFDGDQFGIYLSTGYEMRFSELLVVPTARLQYIRATIDSYSEDRVSNPGAPGSGLNVQIDDQTYRSFALGLGGQVSYAMSQSWGVLLPYASLEYVHDFEKNDSAVTGTFVNDDPTAGKKPFTLPVDSNDQNYFNLAIGASAQFTNGTAGFVNYEQLMGYSDVSQYRINAGLRFEF